MLLRQRAYKVLTSWSLREMFWAYRDCRRRDDGGFGGTAPLATRTLAEAVTAAGCAGGFAFNSFVGGSFSRFSTTDLPWTPRNSLSRGCSGAC
jgi:hypothetical protein